MTEPTITLTVRELIELVDDCKSAALMGAPGRMENPLWVYFKQKGLYHEAKQARELLRGVGTIR